MKNLMIVVIIISVVVLTAYAGIKVKASVVAMQSASAAAIDKVLASQ